MYKIKTALTILLFVLTHLTFAQTIFPVDGFAKEYYGKIEISDTSEVFSKGWIAIYDRKTNKEIIKVVSDELALSLHDGKAIANIKSLPYGEQSLIMYDDFNFDGKKDFAIENGQNSCYHGPSFKVYLATDKGFSFSEAFTRLAQEYCGMFQVDYNEKKILTMTKSGCCWHEFSEFVIKDNKPKAVKIITDEQNFPFNIFTEQTWNGKQMVKKTTKTIETDQEGIQIILSFIVPKNGKKIILYNINDRTLNYALVSKDSTVEFSYPIETIYQNPDFKFDNSANNHSVTFSNKNATYKIYEKPGETGIEITVDGKIYNWVGDSKTRTGGLDNLLRIQLDNVVTLLSSDKSIKTEDDTIEKTQTTLDIDNKIVYINSNEKLKISKSSLEKALNKKIKSNPITLFKSGDKIQFKTERGYETYTISIYTNNLVENSPCKKQGTKWQYSLNTNVKEENGKCIYEVTNYKDDTKNTIGQTINFGLNDYSGKYLLFICTATTEKYIKNSITRIPYLWGAQNGDFKKDDWKYMEDNVTFSGPANKWEKTYGINKLLDNVSSVWIQMAQGHQKGDDPDGTKSKYYNMEVRVFETKKDAMFYANNIYVE